MSIFIIKMDMLSVTVFLNSFRKMQVSCFRQSTVNLLP
jgi:hypothetical protein